MNYTEVRKQIEREEEERKDVESLKIFHEDLNELGVRSL